MKTVFRIFLGQIVRIRNLLLDLEQDGGVPLLQPGDLVELGQLLGERLHVLVLDVDS